MIIIKEKYGDSKSMKYETSKSGWIVHELPSYTGIDSDGKLTHINFEN